jgi:hypothetical protein
VSEPLALYGQPQVWLSAIYRKRYAFHVVVAEQRYFRADFMDWLITNWHVWLAFEHEADRIWGMGRRHYSARTIYEYLRHDTTVKEGPNELELKLNNNVVPDLARLYILMHPDRDGFFERRVNPLSVRAA